MPAQAATQRRATDAPLRENMQEILTAVKALGHFEHGHMRAAVAEYLRPFDDPAAAAD